MPNQRYLIFLLFSLLLSIPGFGQKINFDSVANVYLATDNLQKKVALLLLLDENFELLNPAEENSILQKISASDNKQGHEVLAYYIDLLRIKYYINNGHLDSAQSIVNKIDKPSLTANIPETLKLNITYNGLRLLIKKGEYKTAIEGLFVLMPKAEALQDRQMSIRINNLIGLCYMLLEQNNEAINWFSKALAISNTFIPDYPYSAIINNNLASCYNNVDKIDTAIIFVNEGIAISKRSQNPENLANSYNILADIYIKQNKLKEAEQLFLQAIELRKLKGNPDYVASDLAQLSIYYGNTKEYEKGITAAKAALDTIAKYKIDSKWLYAYQALIFNYKQKGDLQNYSRAMEKLLQIKDSIYQKNASDEFEKLKSKYEFEKNQNIISSQKMEILKKNWMVYGGSILTILAGITFLLLYRNLKRRDKEKLMQAVYDEKLIAAKQVSEAENKERKRIAADLHDNLGVQATAILHNADSLKEDKVDSKIAAENLQQMAKGMMVHLRDTLWAMNSDNLDGIAIWLRIKNFAQLISRQYPTYSIGMEGNPPTNNFQSHSALNIIMIVQELINNSIKHSKGTIVKVRSILQNEKWLVEVEDNGIGFEPSATSNEMDSKFGLANIMERSKTSQIEFHIQTELGKGTKASLLIPIKSK